MDGNGLNGTGVDWQHAAKKAKAGRMDSRRSFTPEFKLEVLNRAREIKGTGRGKLKDYLREKDLRTSHLAEWTKQFSRGIPPEGKRGRPPKSREELARENASLRQRLEAMEKRAAQAERLVMLQMKYVKGAAMKLERRDRGLLSQLIALIDSESSVSSICEALAITRRDFYRTIRPLGR